MSIHLIDVHLKYNDCCNASLYLWFYYFLGNTPIDFKITLKCIKTLCVKEMKEIETIFDFEENGG